MSITDELREYVEKQIKWLDMTKVHYRELFAIADRIDAEHLKALDELFNALTIDMKPMTDENMAEHGWVRLPKDADGVPIHVGDVMAYADNTNPKEVVALVPPSVVMVEDGPRYADMCRHYHAPTVEDVLREFVHAILNQKADYREQNIAEYAKRLKLAESED